VSELLNRSCVIGLTEPEYKVVELLAHEKSLTVNEMLREIMREGISVRALNRVLDHAEDEGHL